MSSPAGPPSDDSALLVRLGLLLRVGSVVSALVILVGGVIYLRGHGSDKQKDLAKFEEVESRFSRPGPILVAAREGSGRALVQLGLLLLIATPVVRVAYSVVAFACRRDWLYLGLTLTVLAVLLVGLFSGRRR